MKSRVLLACASDWQAPARLPKIFHRAGFEVHVLCPRDAGIVHTKYVDRVHEAPAEMEAFVIALRRHLAENKPDRAIAIDDPLLAALTLEARQHSWPKQILPIDPSSPFVDLVASKAALVRSASDIGLRIPRSLVARSPREATDAAREIGFPVILKVDRSFAGMGVARIDDASEIERAWETLRPTGDVVVQAFVAGALGNTAVLYSKGTPVTWMSALKWRTWPGAFGPSCARRFVDRADLGPMITRFGSETHYDGFAAFDWIADDSDRTWILEVNARPVPALHMGVHAGVDFADAIASWRDVEERKTIRATPQRMANQAITNQAVFPMFPEDFHRAITDADVAGLDQFKPGRIGYTDIPWDDPPLLAHLLRRRATRRAFDRILGTIETHEGNTRALARHDDHARSSEL